MINHVHIWNKGYLVFMEPCPALENEVWLLKLAEGELREIWDLPSQDMEVVLNVLSLSFY